MTWFDIIKRKSRNYGKGVGRKDPYNFSEYAGGLGATKEKQQKLKNSKNSAFWKAFRERVLQLREELGELPSGISEAEAKKQLGRQAYAQILEEPYLWE